MVVPTAPDGRAISTKGVLVGGGGAGVNGQPLNTNGSANITNPFKNIMILFILKPSSPVRVLPEPITCHLFLFLIF
jgi:hypothetical protein